MPFLQETYLEKIRIGIWWIAENEAALRTGITLSPSSMSLINRSKSGKRRLELLATRRLAHRMGVSDHDLYYGGNEEPLLRNGGYISISHSEGMVCIALSPEEPIGIDIQQIKPQMSAVLRWLNRSSGSDDALSSTLSWTAREAMFKIRGEKGLTIRDFDVILPQDISQEGCFTGYFSKTGTGYTIFYRILKGYVLSVARMQP